MMFLRPRRQSRSRRRAAAGLNVIARVRFAPVLCVVTALALIALGLRGAAARQEGAPGGAKKSVAATEESSEQTPAVGRPLKQRDDRDLDRVFRKRESIKMSPVAAARRARETGKLAFATSDKTFDIELEPNDLRAADYRAEEVLDGGVVRQLERGPVRTFKGSVRGMAGAQARFTIDEDGVEGVVITRGEQYFIEPAREYSKTADADEFVLYKASDVIETAPAECGTTLAEEVAAEAEAIGSKQPTASALTASGGAVGEVLSPMRVIELATDADYEYHNALGGSTQANDQIQRIINQVDGIYQVELGLTFTIVFQNVYATADDPYTRTEASGQSGALAQFRDYWNANRTGVTRDVAHLWTGKDLSGSTIGVAYLASTCRSPNSAYGISQRYPTTSSNPITAATVGLTAHEIGHNFSAQHTDEVSAQVPADFEASCGNTIMEASLGSGGGMNFCPYSRSQIEGHANAYSSCLATAGAPPANPPCGETPIASGVPVSGSLLQSDCRAPSRGVGFYADRYAFNAAAGQEVTITLSSGFDPYVYLIGPDGSVITQDDDGGDGDASRIPEGSGFFTLPLTGKYIIEATSFERGVSGAYNLGLNFSGCTLSVSPANHALPAGGGGASVNVAAGGGCPWSAATASTSFASWITINSGSSGNGSGAVSFSVSPNTGEAARTGALIVAGQRVNVTQSGTGPDCTLTPISSGQTVNGTLQSGDCRSPNRGARYADRYTFNAAAGQQAVISSSSSAVDTFLTLIGPNGVVILNDDDSGGETNSRIPGGAGSLTLLLPGTYTVEASTYDENQTGSYALNLSLSDSQWEGTALTAQQMELRAWTTGGTTSAYAKLLFPNAGYRVVEWGQVTRTGNDFTVDARIERFVGPSLAAQTSTANIYDLGQLAAGGPYAFTFKTSGSVANTLPFTVSAAPASNPIDDPREFVRWQYKDFLSREPDGPGWDHWTGEITECTDPARRRPGESEAQCVDRKRANTSGAFFLSTEFQNTGYFAVRFYRGTLGRMPKLSEWSEDSRQVSQGIVVNNALVPDTINANKRAFADAFVQRAEFRATYDPLNNEQYVDKLFTVTQIAPTAEERAALVNGLNAGSETRATVAFKVVDGTQTAAGGQLVFQTRYGRAFYDQQYNPAFVLMQYFGYLRRDPDDGGYSFWLTKLNLYGNFADAEMVRAFIVSPEYRSRFGQP